MAGRYRYDNFWYTPTVPKEVKGGIKAQSKRGAFAKKWWGKRWVQTLEGFNIGARLKRGRSYARKGQVADLEIFEGGVSAKVQGSRSGAYKVSIKLKNFSDKEWRLLIERLVEKPIYAAQLLGNVMPEDIEAAFEEAGLSLFPQRRIDLETDCSCPDWSNPCKHIAAVFYLMAETFDNDPFLLFKLRGLGRDKFIEKLKKTGIEEKLAKEHQEIEPEPLPLDFSRFWGDKKEYTPTAINISVRLHAALPKRLGPLPFWRSEKDFIKEMEIIYGRAANNIENKFFPGSQFLTGDS